MSHSVPVIHQDMKHRVWIHYEVVKYTFCYGYLKDVNHTVFWFIKKMYELSTPTSIAVNLTVYYFIKKVWITVILPLWRQWTTLIWTIKTYELYCLLLHGVHRNILLFLLLKMCATLLLLRRDFVNNTPPVYQKIWTRLSAGSLRYNDLTYWFIHSIWTISPVGSVRYGSQYPLVHLKQGSPKSPIYYSKTLKFSSSSTSS